MATHATAMRLQVGKGCDLREPVKAAGLMVAESSMVQANELGEVGGL